MTHRAKKHEASASNSDWVFGYYTGRYEALLERVRVMKRERMPGWGPLWELCEFARRERFTYEVKIQDYQVYEWGFDAGWKDQQEELSS